MIEPLSVAGSLRQRLMATLICGSAILAIVLYFVVRGYTTQIAQDGQDDILRASVSSILDAAVIRDGQVEVDFPYASFSMLDTDFDDRITYAIYQDDLLLSGYQNVPHQFDGLGDTAAFRTVHLNDVNFRVASASRMLLGAQNRTVVSVSVGQTQDALISTLARISRNVAILCATFFGLIVLLSYFAAMTTISPLKRLALSVKRRGPQDLSPFEKPVPSEMVPLVSSLNSLMGRLDQSLTQSEDFIAEAAHRVRTPLATVRSYADATLQRVSNAENRDALKSMIRAIDESSRAAGQLLDHAMITFRADHLDRQNIDLLALVQDLALRLSPIAEMRDVSIHVHGNGPVDVSGDPILLQNAIRNVIDNALKYSPSESVVDIYVTDTPRIQVVICDQGMGFPNDGIEDLTLRFERGTNAEGTIGSGLGLTIAKDVARAHNGELVLSNQSKGGACVTLSL